jgi:DNA excision repair protein ERCC-3
MAPHPDNPLIVQSDLSVLVEVHAPRYAEARDALARFAELEKSPEHIHTYRISPLSLWNAATTGLTAAEVLATLEDFSKYDLPANVRAEVSEYLSRWGRLRLLPAPSEGEPLRLEVLDTQLATRLSGDDRLAPLLGGRLAAGAWAVPLGSRGTLKQALLRLGFPVDDQAGFTPGAPHDFALRTISRAGLPFSLRDYQEEAVRVFLKGGVGTAGGHGVVVLPCGSGKTLVGLAAAAALRTRTLVLTTSRPAAHQWMHEALDKTTLDEADVGEYTGTTKRIRPFTVATYHIVSHRGRKGSGAEYPHYGLFDAADWGLILYDEVHLLPAPVFRITAQLQARRRLGLTATLVREDRKEGDVFSLIGPKRYDVPWKEMEARGYIAQAACYEIRLDLPEARQWAYATATDGHESFRIAAENPDKHLAVQELVKGHAGERILVIGHYVSQITELARRLKAPLLTGETSTAERERHFDAFREGKERLLVLSRVGNFSIDLPSASVLIQVSGLFGSRQEEAQRLGRILRPKEGTAIFYTLVTRGTVEQQYALHRQMFLTEQGYRYYIEEWTRSGEAPVTSDPAPPGPLAPLPELPGS